MGPKEEVLGDFAVPEDDAPWIAIADFAQTFNGYLAFPDGAANRVANEVRSAYMSDASSLQRLSLSELRCSLFFE